MAPDQEPPRCLDDSGERRAGTLMVRTPWRSSIFLLHRIRQMLRQCKANAGLTERSSLKIGKPRTLPPAQLAFELIR
jgi:hypothetical protein